MDEGWGTGDGAVILSNLDTSLLAVFLLLLMFGMGATLDERARSEA